MLMAATAATLVSSCSQSAFLSHPNLSYPSRSSSNPPSSFPRARCHLLRPNFVAPLKCMPFRFPIRPSLAGPPRACVSSRAVSDPGSGVGEGGLAEDVGGGGAGMRGEGYGSGGGGGRGGGGEDRKEGGSGASEGGEGNKKGGGMSTSQKLTLGYATLVGVGGFMGYFKGGSQKSLAFGGSSALLLYFVYTQLPLRPAFASSLGLSLSAALLVVMGSRFRKSGKIFPAGVVSFVSFVMVGGYFHGILRSLHG